MSALHIIGLERERLPVASDGLLQLPLPNEHVSQVVMRGGVGGIAGERSGDPLRGLLVFTALIGDDARKVQGVDVLRIDRQYLPISRFGLGQAPRLMMLQSDIDLLRKDDSGALGARA